SRAPRQILLVLASELKKPHTALQNMRHSDSPTLFMRLAGSPAPIHPQRSSPTMQEMKLQDLKVKSPTELLSVAQELAVENARALRKQELMFAILKQLASRDI